jgi:Uma2 family endonuclease
MELDLHEPGRAVGRDYRRPDLIVARPEDLSERAVEGHAELVVEILSKGDRSRLKFPFYARCQVPEVWLVEPDTRQLEVHVPRGDTYEQLAPNARAPLFDLEIGPGLRINGIEI